MRDRAAPSPLCYALPTPLPAPPDREDDVAFRMPKIRLGPKPKTWDLPAFVVLVLSAVLAVIDWRTLRAQQPGVSPSGSFTALVVALQLAICTVSLLLLGKTAKRGTLWGNLAAIGGMLGGLGGVLLAAALWVAA